MNNVPNDSERPKRNTTCPTQPHPTYRDHEYEAIAHELGAALKRSVKRGGLEAE